MKKILYFGAKCRGNLPPYIKIFNCKFKIGKNLNSIIYTHMEILMRSSSGVYNSNGRHMVSLIRAREKRD